MSPTYKQSCKVNPVALDFSAFEKKDIREEQFAHEELYDAGITKKQGELLRKAASWARGLKNSKALVVVAAVAVIGGVVLSMALAGLGGIIAGFILLIPLIYLALYVLGWVEEAKRRIQLKWLLFAKQNGFKYHVSLVGYNNPEALAFQIGYGGEVSNVLEIDDRLSVAEYTYKTKIGEEEVSHHFNFARFDLQNNVPHLVLDSKFSALQIVGEQEISLEGNFQDYFTLYTQEGFHIDALQIFTPDVMSKLLDQEGKYDLELVGSDLYIYEMHQGLIESGLTVGILANETKDKERHSRFINFLSSVIEIASEIDEQTNRYIRTGRPDANQ